MSTSTGTTTETTIADFYTTILNRTGSADEIQSWVSVVDSGALTLDQVENAFIVSPETQQNVVPIVEIYQAELGRAPDAAGLAGWVAAESTLSLEQIADDIANSDESQAFYGTSSTVDDAFLTALYQTVLGRAPDTDGLTAWLNSGLTRAQIEYGFATSPEAVARAVPAADAFLASVSQGGAYGGSLYQNPVPPGGTFTLTTGVDALTGTDGDDTFVGSVTPGIPGLFGGGTLNAGDSIDGGAGFNTLNIIDTVGNASNDLAGVTLNSIQNVVVQNTTNHDVLVDFSLSPDVSQVVALNTAHGGVDSFANLATGAQVIASGAASGGGGSSASSSVFFSYANPTDAVSVGVDGGVNGVEIIDDTTGAAATAATISSTGAANGTTATDNEDSFILTNGAASIKTLSIDAETNLVATLTAGDYVATGADLTVFGAATSVDLSEVQTAFKTIDASGLAGGLTIDDSGANLTSFTGGSGDDTLNLAAGVIGTTTATLDGGDGINTLGIGDSGALTAAMYKGINTAQNFQVLALNGSATVDVSKLTSIDAFKVGHANPTVTFANADDNSAFTIDNSRNTGTVTIGEATGNHTTSVTLDAGAATGPETLGTLDVHTASTVNLDSTGTGTGGANVITTLANADNSDIVITGNEDLTITNGLAGTTGSLVDASAFTGKLTITGSAGNDTIIAGSGKSMIAGGGGNDKIDLTNGSNDTVKLLDASTDTITGFQVGALASGGDTLSFLGVQPPLTAAPVGNATALTATGGGVFTVDFANAIASDNFAGANFGSLFGSGSFLATTAINNGNQNLLAVQGTDQTDIYVVTGTGGAIVAGDLTLKAVLSGVTDSSHFVAANFA